MLKLSLSTLQSEFCVADQGRVVRSDEFLSALAGYRQKVSSQGERLALCFDDSYLFCVAFFSVLSLGRQAVLLPNNKAATLAAFRGEYDAVLSDEDFVGFAPSMNTQGSNISLDAKIIFFTSGSTGAPKKVTKRFENIYAEVLNLEKQFGPMLKQAQVLATVTHQHIYGFLFKILWPICAQRTWHSKTLEFPEQIQKCSEDLRSFALISTPAFLKRCYLPKVRIQNCSCLFSSGGPLPYDCVPDLEKHLGVRPIEIYGSTESGGVAHRQRLSEDEAWQLFAGIRASTDGEGQLCLQSPYFDEPKLTMADQVTMQGAGFVLNGRSDDVVKIEEKRISLSAINKKILEIPWIQDSVVMAMEIRGRQQTVCVAVMKNSDHDPETAPAEIRKHLSTYFEVSVLPRKFRFLSKLPYSSESKLSRSQLLEYFHDR